MKRFNLFILFLAMLLCSSNVCAIVIGGDYINPSTTLSNVSYPFNDFTIDQIADGITSDVYPYNGFASPSSSGVISLDLLGVFNLQSFILWNDINVSQEGIKEFTLNFYDVSDDLIQMNFSTTFEAPLGQVEEEEYVFNEFVSGVSRVDLIVLNSQPYIYNRIEIREVAFRGDPVPEPSTALLLLSVSIPSILWLRKRILNVS